MPVVSMFYGLIVSMYYIDNKKHNLPHIHVRFGGDEAVYSIPDGDRLEGELPKAKERLILAWIELRKDDLMSDWYLAIRGEKIYPIEPLK